MLNWTVDAAFYTGGRFQSENSVYQEAAGTDSPWLFASAARGLRKLAIPLLAAGDGKARYRVRLGFLEPEDSAEGKRVFSVRLQGQAVATGFDIAREAGGSRRVVWKEFTGVEVEDALLVELVAAGNPTQPSEMPLLHALELVREQFLAPGCVVPSFLLNDRQPTQAGAIRMANLDDQPYRGRLVLEAPAGLAVEPEEMPLELAADSRSEHEVRVKVGPHVAAGTYEIPVRLLRTDGSLELQRTLRVEHLGSRGRVVLKAVEDAHVTRNAVDRNFGVGSVLLVDGGDQQMADRLHSVALLKFRIAVPGRPVSARLRIANAGNPTGDAGRICLVETPWSEAKVTYTTRPELGRELARLGRMAEREVVECELPAELLSVAELSLAIDPTGTDGYDLLSRESGSAAELVIEYE